jgi:hypothetical protein
MTTGTQERFFLFIGASWIREAAPRKLQASGIPYRWKRLDSKPDNWELVLGILQDPSLAGVIGQINVEVYNLISSSDYEEVAGRLFRTLGNVSHIMLVHEAILTGEQGVHLIGYDDHENSETYYVEEPYPFPVPEERVRNAVSQLFEDHRINIVPYQTRAELSVLASAFIDDNENNLLFRIYVPAGRLYAAEADKLLSLFQDWLSHVGKHRIRQDGYRTASGQVYEFFGDASLTHGQLTREFDEFSGFLDLCTEDFTAAIDFLSHAGVNRRSATDMVTRYGKQVRRLNLDLKHERESRMLGIKHSLESELVEADGQIFIDQVNDLAEALVPTVGRINPMRLLALASSAPSGGPVTVNINQQVIRAAESTVVQNIRGTTNISSEAKELLSLVERFGGQNATALESAVHELEDQDARLSDRLGAKQRLRGFLIQLGGKIEDTALAILQRYIESKMGQ